MTTTTIAPPARLGDVLDVDNLKARIADRYIDFKKHPGGVPLAILDYSRTTQFEQVWDNETILCRGLIVSLVNGDVTKDSTIVARGLAKFFTIEQHQGLADKGIVAPLPDEPFEVFTKEDGSLGTAYTAPDGRPAIATRGMFHSPQAMWATAHLRADPDLESAVAQMLTTGTPCFEIISPVSRIVKTYDFEGLVLLAHFDRATGADLPLPAWPGRTVTRHDGLGDYTELAALNWPNEEGFVIRFASGVRVKTKFAEYVRLHRIVTGTSTSAVWEHLAVAAVRDAGKDSSFATSRLHVDHRFVNALYEQHGDPIERMLECVPREFADWVEATVADLRQAYAEREQFYTDLFASLPTGLPRKDIAKVIMTEHRDHFGALFALLDGQSITANIWVDIKPAHVVAFAEDLDG